MMNQKYTIIIIFCSHIFACSAKKDERSDKKPRKEFAENKTQDSTEKSTERQKTGVESRAEVIEVKPEQNTSIERVIESVIIDGTQLAALPSWMTSDVSLLPTNWFSSLRAVHKNSATETIFFGQQNKSWIMTEEENPGLLSEVEFLDLNLPDTFNVYVTSDSEFWAFDESSIALPIGIDDAGQVQIAFVEPPIVTEDHPSFQVRFVSKNFAIISSERKVNIIEKQEENRAMTNTIALTFPDFFPADQLVSAGLQSDSDGFWFATNSKILFLNRNQLTQNWTWLQANLAVSVANQNVNSIAWAPSYPTSNQLILNGKFQFLITEAGLFNLGNEQIMFTTDVTE